MEGLLRVHGCRASFDVVQLGVVVHYDEGPLELTAPLVVDPEIRLQGHVQFAALGYVDEGPSGPYGAVEGGILVVRRGYQFPEVLHEQVRVFAEAGIGVQEDHALLLHLAQHVAVDGLGLVMSRHPGEELLLRLGDTEFVEGPLHIVWHILPSLRHAVADAGEVGVILEVYEVQGRSEGRLFVSEELPEGFQTEVQHELRFVLGRGYLPDGVLVQAPVGLVDRIYVVAELVFRTLVPVEDLFILGHSLSSFAASLNILSNPLQPMLAQVILAG